MRPIALASLLILAGAASADAPAWTFHPGQTYTYECRSWFEYAVHTGTMAGGSGEGGDNSEGGGGGGG